MSTNEKVETGVMVVKNGKAWGVTIDNGNSRTYGWMPILEGKIYNPAHYTKPTDIIHKQSKFFDDLSTATLTHVVRKTTIEIVPVEA